MSKIYDVILNTTNFKIIDNLVYTYTENKLDKVDDSSGSNEGFKDGANITTEYRYAPNGNIKNDANKGISDISYNYLNLPTQVTLAGGVINYVYDATGAKQRKIVGTITTDYANGFQYENNILQFFPQLEGYVNNNSGTFEYIYQYKDHLGNVRLSYDKNLSIVEENNYYPFGLKQKGYNDNVSSLGNAAAKKYKYNGKELQDELGLNMYDYGARNYDPVIGRWINADPLLNDLDFTFNPNNTDDEDESAIAFAMVTTLGNGGGIYNTDNLNPYSYGYNDPIRFDDPDGRCPNCITAGLGALLGGGIELAGQLFSGKSLSEVDWADVGVEALKGGLIGSGVGAGAALGIEAGAVVTKASFDVSATSGNQNVFNGKKSVKNAVVDGAIDIAAGAAGGAAGKKLGKMATAEVKAATKAETRATKNLVKASNTFNKITNGGANMTGSKSMIAQNTFNKASGVSKVARSTTVRAQMVKAAVKSPAGSVVNKAAQNSAGDKIKRFFGF